MEKSKIKNQKLKIIVAMSGGVDSSVAAALLKRAGFNPHTKRGQSTKGAKIGKASPHYGVGINVMGVFMRLYDSPRFKEGEKRAKKVAKILKIPLRVLDLRKEFKKKVISYFLREYRKGQTPNPCVVCNKEIKFGILLEKALALGADYIVTGHYVRLHKFVNSKKICYSLMIAKDKNKDQSYFLWQLSQKQLKHILFPIGDCTKKEVKNLARKFKLPISNTTESQEICFIRTTVNDFLRKYIKSKPGPICLEPGSKQVGWHQGLVFYTIGQRKGLGLADGPFWVLGKEPKKNLLIVTKNERDLYKKELSFEKANWISGKEPRFPSKVKAKIRYRHRPASAILLSGKVVFDRPQRAITPGQSVVFYKGEELLGGGIIK